MSWKHFFGKVYQNPNFVVYVVVLIFRKKLNASRYKKDRLYNPMMTDSFASFNYRTVSQASE